MPALPLAGRRVLVTRAARQAGKLSEGLRALGAEPVEVPVLEIRPPVDFAPLDRALHKLDSYNWLILTSANTVRALSERAETLGVPLAAARDLKVAAVGEATASAAHMAGLPVAVVPETYIAESLVDKLLRAGQEAPGQDLTIRGETSSTGGLVSGHEFTRAANAPKSARALAPEGSFSAQRVLLARAAIARDVIPDALRAAGAKVDVVDAYRNVIPEAAPGLLREALRKGIDAATFTSSSSATHLADAARQAGIAFPFAGVAAISIGPITSQTLREHGWEPVAEASPSDIPGLLRAVVHALR